MPHDSDTAEALRALGQAAPALLQLANAAPALTAALMTIAGLTDRMTVLEDELKKEKVNHENQINSLQKRMAYLESRQENSENRSRRKNLLLFNVREERQETWDDCREKVVSMSESVGVQLSRFSIQRAHRIGNVRPLPGKPPRPIIALFSHWQEKESVSARGSQFRDQHGVSLGDDYAERTRKARSVLVKRMKQERANGRWARLVFDTLYIGKKGNPGSHALKYDDETKKIVKSNGGSLRTSEPAPQVALPGSGSNLTPLGERAGSQSQQATSSLLIPDYLSQIELSPTVPQVENETEAELPPSSPVPHEPTPMIPSAPSSPASEKFFSAPSSKQGTPVNTPGKRIREPEEQDDISPTTVRPAKSTKKVRNVKLLEEAASTSQKLSAFGFVSSAPTTEENPFRPSGRLERTPPPSRTSSPTRCSDPPAPSQLSDVE